MQIVRNEPEEWRPVVGHEGLYEVSSHGNVRSVERVVAGKCGSVQVRPSIALRPSTSAGYPAVALHRDAKAICRRVHRLVAMAFVPNPHKKPQVNHIDGNKTNNLAENLEWATREENMQHCLTHIGFSSKHDPQRRPGMGGRRISIEQIDKSGHRAALYPSLSAAAAAIGRNSANISSCLSGRRNFCGGFIWKTSQHLQAS